MKKKAAIAVSHGDGLIGRLIDELHKLREQQRALTKKEKALNEKEHAKESELLGALSRAKLDGAKGKRATASVHSLLTCKVEEWPRLTAWMKRTGHFEILQKRVSTTTYKEMLDAKVRVPGIVTDVINSIGLTKRSK